MLSLKISHRVFALIVVYSVITLCFHIAALKLIYHMVELGEYSKELAQGFEKEDVGRQMHAYIGHSEKSTHIFLMLCYAFIPLIGLLLIFRRINYITFIVELIIFGGIQVIGVYLFALFFNKYSMSGTFGRLNIYIHQRITLWSFIVPSVIYAFEYIFIGIKGFYRKSHQAAKSG